MTTLIATPFTVIALPPFGRRDDNFFLNLDRRRLLYFVVLTIRW